LVQPSSDPFWIEKSLVVEEVIVESVLRSAPEVDEVLPGVTKHLDWSPEEKLRILATECIARFLTNADMPDARVSSGELYTWRKQFRSGNLTGFISHPVATRSGRETCMD
jgi:transposase